MQCFQKKCLPSDKLSFEDASNLFENLTIGKGVGQCFVQVSNGYKFYL